MCSIISVLKILSLHYDSTMKVCCQAIRINDTRYILIVCFLFFFLKSAFFPKYTSRFSFFFFFLFFSLSFFSLIFQGLFCFVLFVGWFLFVCFVWAFFFLFSYDTVNQWIAATAAFRRVVVAMLLKAASLKWPFLPSKWFHQDNSKAKATTTFSTFCHITYKTTVLGKPFRHKLKSKNKFLK